MEVIPQRTALSGTGTSSIAPAGFDVFEVGGGTDAGAGSIALPRVASSTLSTTVLLKSGQTAVLGGLKSKTETETVTKLPLLGDIPVLGYLFKNRTRQETMSTLLVFITPQIIRSADDMEESMRRALEERMKDQRSTQTANSYASQLKVGRVGDDERVDGKSIMGMMMLAAEKGVELELEATGPDADAMLRALAELVDANFGEE